MRPVIPVEAAELAERIKSFRKKRGWNQQQLAELCEVTQSAVSKWEKAIDRPGMQALLAIAGAAGEDDGDWWMKAALPWQEAEPVSAGADVRMIPYLRDSAAAGTPREVDEREIEARIAFPRRWVKSGGSLVALKIAGDSMEPVLLDGHVVIVDTSSRDPKLLENKMVVARDNGITVKWLRFQDGVYLLVPQHVSVRHPVRLITSESGIGIVGEVVKWIGEPPPVRRK